MKMGERLFLLAVVAVLALICLLILGVVSQVRQFSPLIRAVLFGLGSIALLSVGRTAAVIICEPGPSA